MSGQYGLLPSNQDIRNAATFLRQHFQSELPSGPVDAIISGAPIVISRELAQNLRTMFDTLEKRSVTDNLLRRRLTYIPNQIPEGVRTVHIVLSMGLLGYGGLGLWRDDIYIRGKRSLGMHFHGEPAWIVAAAILCAVLNLLAVVIDHYDHRDNERVYEVVAKITQTLGWSLFFLAIILDIFVFKKGTR